MHEWLLAHWRETCSKPARRRRVDSRAVSLTGWMIAAGGLIGVMITAGWHDSEFIAYFAVLAGLGLVSAIPGTTVFKKCRRR